MRPTQPLCLRTHQTAHPGFTLIELLVVIGIIGLLIGITLVVGNQVVTGGKKQLTTDTLRVLDQSLEAYIHATGGGIPDPTAALLDPAQPNLLFPAADAKDMVNQPLAMINSVGVYFYQASKVPEAKAILDKLPSKVVRTYDPDGPAGVQPSLMTVFDG